MTWIEVMDEATLQEGAMTAVYPKGINVVIVRVGGALYAFSGKCPHMACPLANGSLAGRTLTCGCHDWRFDIQTGRFLDAPEIGIEVYSVRSEAGRLSVRLG